LSQIDVEDALTSDQEHDEAEEDPGTGSVGKELPGVLDVGHAQDIELLLAGTTSGVDGKQDGHRDDASYQAHDDLKLQEAQEQVSIDALVLKHEGIGNLPQL
jgi:hypothetical protein